MRLLKKDETRAKRGMRRSKTWGIYSSGSSQKICMYGGMITKVVTLGVDIVRSGE